MCHLQNPSTGLLASLCFFLLRCCVSKALQATDAAWDAVLVGLLVSVNVLEDTSDKTSCLVRADCLVVTTQEKLADTSSVFASCVVGIEDMTSRISLMLELDRQGWSQHDSFSIAPYVPGGDKQYLRRLVVGGSR